MDQRVFNYFQRMIEATMGTAERCSGATTEAAQAIADALLQGNRILTCGEGANNNLASLLSDYLSQGMDMERPGLPSLNINQLAPNHFSLEHYSQLLQLHGNPGDVVVIICAGNGSLSLQHIIDGAHQKGVQLILINTESDKALAEKLDYGDIVINLGELSGSMLSLGHLQVIQCISQLVDDHLFGEQ